MPSLFPAQPGFLSSCVSLSVMRLQSFRLLAGLYSLVPGGFWRMLGSSEEQEKAPLASVLMCSVSQYGERQGMVTW